MKSNASLAIQTQQRPRDVSEATYRRVVARDDGVHAPEDVRLVSLPLVRHQIRRGGRRDALHRCVYIHWVGRG